MLQLTPNVVRLKKQSVGMSAELAVCQRNKKYSAKSLEGFCRLQRSVTNPDDFLLFQKNWLTQYSNKKKPKETLDWDITKSIDFFSSKTPPKLEEGKRLLGLAWLKIWNSVLNKTEQERFHTFTPRFLENPKVIETLIRLIEQTKLNEIEQHAEEIDEVGLEIKIEHEVFILSDVDGNNLRSTFFVIWGKKRGKVNWLWRYCI